VSTAHASGLIDLAQSAGPTVGPLLLCIITMVIVAVVGGVGHIVLTLCDSGKTVRLVDKGTYIALLGTLIGMGLLVIGNVFDLLMKFIRLVFG
jgi:hypothetical protein